MKLTTLDIAIFDAVRARNAAKVIELLDKPGGKYALAKFNDSGESLLSIAIGSWNKAIVTLLLNHPSNMCLLVLEPAKPGASDPKAMIGEHFTMDASWSELLNRIWERSEEDKSLVQREFAKVVVTEEASASGRVLPPPLPASMYAASGSGGGYGEASAVSGYGAGGFGGGYGVARGSFERDREMALRLQRDEEDLLAGFRAAEAIVAAAEEPDEPSLRLAREFENERIAAEYAKRLAEEEAQEEALNDGALAAWLEAGNDGDMPEGFGFGMAAAVPAPVAFAAPAPRAGGAVGVAGGDIVDFFEV